MALTRSRAEARDDAERDEIDQWGLDPAGVEARCFQCGWPVHHPAIYWWGGRREMIYLHGECATYLGGHLMRDADELRRRFGLEAWTA